MFSVHAEGQIPGVFGVEGVADNDFSGSIRPALLKMVAIGDPGVVVTDATGPFGAIGFLTLKGQWVPIESPEDDLVMQRDLGGSRSWVNDDDGKGNGHS